MPRTLDPDHFMESSAGQPAVLQVNPKDALAMYGVRMQMPDAPMLRRAFHALVAMFQAAHNCDFYITKYHAKPMEQMQSLLTNIALGLRRLEAEKEVAEESAEQPKDLPEERARRTILKIANAANRSSWCSCCEMATFIKTGALVRKTHRPIVIFLSRPLYLYEQCRRLLQSGHETLIEAKDTCDEQARDVDALCFTTLKKDSAVQPVSNPADDSDVETSAGNHPDESDADNSEGGSAHILQEQDADSEDIEDDVEQAGSVRNDVEQAEDVNQIPQTLGDDAKVEPFGDDLEISALEATTSAHDDWLHRGSFLFDMDFHTYIRFTVRRPRPKELKISNLNCAEHVFVFDFVAKLVVMEANILSLLPVRLWKLLDLKLHYILVQEYKVMTSRACVVMTSRACVREEDNKVSIQLRDFWSSQDLYFVLPNKVYFFLGAQIIDSEGECDWYSLRDALFTYPHCNVLESESRRYKKR